MTEDAAEAEQEEGGGGQRHQDEDRHRQQRPLQAQEMSPGVQEELPSRAHGQALHRGNFHYYVYTHFGV